MFGIFFNLTTREIYGESTKAVVKEGRKQKGRKAAYGGTFPTKTSEGT